MIHIDKMPPKKIDKGKGKAKAEADQAPTGELPKRIRTKSAKAKEAQTNAEAAEAARSKVKKVPIPSPLGLDAAVSGSYHLAFAPGNGPVEPALGPEQGLTTAADEHAPGLDLPAAAAICLDRHGGEYHTALSCSW